MKKIYLRVLMAVAVVAGTMSFAGCNKDNDMVRGILIRAENHQPVDKSIVNGTAVHWANNDAIWINGEECHVTVNGSTVSVNDFNGSGAIYAYSPYSMTVTNPQTSKPTIEFPSRFLSTFNGDNQIIDLPMAAYAAADATSIMFKNISSAVRVRVRNNTANVLYIDSVVVRHSLYQLCGTKRINLSDANLGVVYASAAGDESKKSVTVYFPANSVSLSVNGIKEVQVPTLPMPASGTLAITVYAHNANISGMAITADMPHTFYLGKSSIALARNEMLTAQVSVNPDGNNTNSPYTFRVAEHKKVYFSKGNLMYTPSTNTWAFHTNQYDVSDDDDIVAFYQASGTNDIDLFGWATTGYQQHNNRSQYQPYSVGTNSGSYGPNDATTDLTNANHGDWGFRMGEEWRTLTESEWYYLIFTRGANLRTKATVNGTRGLILFPDTWNASDCGVSYTANATDYTTNNISSSSWAAMESYGAIFLPAAGQRVGTNIQNRNSSGLYWSSTHGGDGNSGHAMALSFAASTQNASSNHERRNGMSVRLVTDVN